MGRTASVRERAGRILRLYDRGAVPRRDPYRERKPEKERSQTRTEPDNLYFRRREVKQLRAKAKQEVHNLERLIGENETAKRAAEQALTEAQNGNDYRRMQQLYETISELESTEAELYDRLEKAEEALLSIETEAEP